MTLAMKQIFLFILFLPLFSFAQKDVNACLEILNEDITMRKPDQDVVEICLHIHPDTTFFGKTIEFSRYVESNHWACAYMDLQFNLDDLPINGLSYFLETLDGRIVYNQGDVLDDPIDPENRTYIIHVVDKNLKIHSISVNKEEYEVYTKANRITIHNDTVVNVYPLIDWEHYGLKAGRYFLYFMYRTIVVEDGIVMSGPILTSNKVELIVEDRPIRWWEFWRRRAR